ncbi:D-galactoside-specific lectin-like [Mya arenaria]|uniref:D-galactoside-specific lectin-like n=1 Tax=Mya arenaria TaxID=6604 RepID=UPI0022E35FB3|nr:D-galactoside-specific lectin-like [Mya arenaria]
MGKISLLLLAVFGYLALSGVVGDVIVCEDSTVYLSCPEGQQIAVYNANYGRTRNATICPHPQIKSLSCFSSGSFTIVKDSCNEQQECILNASNSVYGDPCVGTFKYLEIQYTCISA